MEISVSLDFILPSDPIIFKKSHYHESYHNELNFICLVLTGPMEALPCTNGSHEASNFVYTGLRSVVSVCTWRVQIYQAPPCLDVTSGLIDHRGVLVNFFFFDGPEEMLL
jgi:hypothetical protein